MYLGDDLTDDEALSKLMSPRGVGVFVGPPSDDPEVVAEDATPLAADYVAPTTVEEVERFS